MMDKTCSNGECRYRYMSSGAIGYGCSYMGYCDFQRPLDSRGINLPYISSVDLCHCSGQEGNDGKCLICHKNKR